MSRITIKTPEEIAKMRAASRITADILDSVTEIIKPGITTEHINTFVHNMMTARGAIPATLDYHGFPKSACTSLNDVICHGIPSSYDVLEAGDIINVDVTSIKNGYHGDSSRMYLVGGEEACSPEAVEVVRVAREALRAGIAEVKPGAHIGDIGAGIQEYIEGLDHPYGIVREYTGHGIGSEFHEPPQILHFGKRGKGPKIKAGMTFTIEPMINIGAPGTVLSKLDGWTVRTADGSLSAQWEHTLVVTEEGSEALTASELFS
ncbi:type I methionyl aminopeptidase [bacterium]|nr:type I methionyl aminopeptidase [bacterium]